MGTAAFSHDFGLLSALQSGREAEMPAVAKTLHSFTSDKPNVSPAMFLFAPVIPYLLRFFGGADNRLRTLRTSLAWAAEDLLKKAEGGDADNAVNGDHSLIGLLGKFPVEFFSRVHIIDTVRSAKMDSENALSPEEVLAQMVCLLSSRLFFLLVSTNSFSFIEHALHCWYVLLLLHVTTFV
jgi:hypothetical protein